MRELKFCCLFLKRALLFMKSALNLYSQQAFIPGNLLCNWLFPGFKYNATGNPSNQMMIIYNDFKQKEPEKLRLFLLIVNCSVFYNYHGNIKIIVENPQNIQSRLHRTDIY